MVKNVINVGGTTIEVPIGSTDYMQWVNCFNRFMNASSGEIFRLNGEVVSLRNDVDELKRLLDGMTSK